MTKLGSVWGFLGVACRPPTRQRGPAEAEPRCTEESDQACASLRRIFWVSTLTPGPIVELMRIFLT